MDIGEESEVLGFYIIDAAPRDRAVYINPGVRHAAWFISNGERGEDFLLSPFMLPIHANNNYTPPPSPPSSPCSPYMTTSSPGSSPMLEPLSPDNDPEDEGEMLPPPARFRSAIDPFSGSYNAKRVKHAFRSVTDHGPSKKSRVQQPTPSPVSPKYDDIFSETGRKREIRTWEAALDKIFESGEREIDLKYGNSLLLTEIVPNRVSFFCHAGAVT